MSAAVRVELPAHLRMLAKSGQEVTVRVDGEVTIGGLLDALERDYPMLAGTIREHGTRRRRDFMRFFACGEDWSFAGAEEPVPAAVAEGRETFVVIGAIAGG